LNLKKKSLVTIKYIMTNENKKIVPKTKFRSYQVENENISTLKNEIEQKQVELDKEIEDFKKQKESELKQRIIEREKFILEKALQLEVKDKIKEKENTNLDKQSLTEEEKKQAKKEYQREYQRIYYWLHKKGLSLDEALERANRQKLSDVVPDKKIRAKIYAERFKEKQSRAHIIVVQE